MKFSHTRFLLFLVLCTLFAACGGGGQGTITAAPTGTSSGKASVPSTSLSLTGLIKNAGSLKLSEIQAFAKVTVSVSNLIELQVVELAS